MLKFGLIAGYRFVGGFNNREMSWVTQRKRKWEVREKGWEQGVEQHLWNNFQRAGKIETNCTIYCNISKESGGSHNHGAWRGDSSWYCSDPCYLSLIQIPLSHLTVPTLTSFGPRRSLIQILLFLPSPPFPTQIALSVPPPLYCPYIDPPVHTPLPFPHGDSSAES